MMRACDKVLGVALAVAAVLFWSAESRGESAVTPAVGVIRLDVPSGLSLVSVPMEQNDGSAHTLSSVFSNKLPSNSEVMIYQPGSGYIVYTYTTRRGWRIGETDAGATILPRGKGFWVRNYGTSMVSVYLSGKVPKSQVQVNLPGSGGLQLTSLSFPLDLSITSMNAEGGISPAAGDEIIVYQDGNYSVHKYSTRGGTPMWRDPANAPSQLIIPPGKAFWYRRWGGETIWTQSLPSGIDL